ncbi:MAG: Rrf2 family transcriptional regulator, partial [Ruminococcus sp.]|nr:Rrf2 family transcriptional regulator [Ruminococcus sp.]
KYLEQIIVSLRQGGFVVGQKGSRGGYVLSRSPEKIFLSQVLDALDNTILADTYEFSDQGDDIRSWVNGCLWEKLNDYMRSLTGQMSLSDLIKEYKANQSQGEELMYYI